MATLGVLTYSSPSSIPLNNGLKASNRVINNNNNNNNNIKINNNSHTNSNNNLSAKGNKATPKREMVIMRKKQKILPLTETRTNIMTGNLVTTMPVAPTVLTPSKPLKRLLPDVSISGVSCASSGGKTKGSPLPIAVARRNARERNRVKQVNNGFAALRERIPDEVAEAFEAQGNGRGSAKKLSKVETLRMAVEYIRSLERILELDSSTGNGLGLVAPENHTLNVSSYQPSDTSSIISTLTPPPSDNISSGSFDDIDLLPDVTTLDGHQYIRIPGTNTYQLLSNDMIDDPSALYENDENMEPLFGDNQHTALAIVHHNDDGYLGPMVDPATTIGYGSMQHTIGTPIHILTPASISPGAYSGQSSTAGLSPATLTNDGNSATATGPLQLAIKDELQQQQQQHQHQQQRFITTAIVGRNDGSDNNDSALYISQLTEPQALGNQPIGNMLTLKREIKDEFYHEHQPLSEENMIEVMDWWNNHQQATHPSDT